MLKRDIDARKASKGIVKGLNKLDPACESGDVKWSIDAKWRKDGRPGDILRRSDGKAVHSHAVWNHKERLELAGHYGNGLNMHAPYHDRRETDRITVAMSRGGEAIAKDILRRLMPGYLVNLAKAKDSKYECDKRDAHKSTVSKALARAIGGEVIDHGNDPEMYLNGGGYYGRGKHYMDTRAKLEIEIPFDLALEICAMIKRHREKKFEKTPYDVTDLPLYRKLKKEKEAA